MPCARLVERRLLGYQLEGWAEEEARPLPRRAMRLPRARGGPLVVCLDTSHSMAGGRELLAKAVVLEAVSIYIYIYLVRAVATCEGAAVAE